MKVNEYDTIYINEDFCDIPAKTKGVVLMIFHGEGDQEKHAEIEFIANSTHKCN